MFYLKVDVGTLIGRVLDCAAWTWESGMDPKHGDDIYDSFAYQQRLLR